MFKRNICRLQLTLLLFCVVNFVACNVNSIERNRFRSGELDEKAETAEFDGNSEQTLLFVIRNNLKTFMGNLRMRAKNTFQHLNMPMKQEGMESSSMSGNYTTDAKKRKPVLQRIKQRMNKGKMTTTTAMFPLQYYGALSQKFQLMDDSEPPYNIISTVSEIVGTDTTEVGNLANSTSILRGSHIVNEKDANKTGISL